MSLEERTALIKGG